MRYTTAVKAAPGELENEEHQNAGPAAKNDNFPRGALARMFKESAMGDKAFVERLKHVATKSRNHTKKRSSSRSASLGG